MIFTDNKFYFEYKFITTFEETNLIGNVYFANYAIWQGRCREIFLYEFCPDVIEEIKNGLLLVTLDMNITFLNQTFVLEKILMRMSIDAKSDTSLLMKFDYYKEENDRLNIVANGLQTIVAMKSINDKMVTVNLPHSLLSFMENYYN
ncbi:MAG: acyl-CoA thioesterase [Bacteroidales bacterium]|nr:acyl-CoA thioesterase [Bacteroidales bacterium]